jgi:hypothetical protein
MVKSEQDHVLNRGAPQQGRAQQGPARQIEWSQRLLAGEPPYLGFLPWEGERSQVDHGKA